MFPSHPPQCHGDRSSLNYFKDVTDTLSGNGSVKHMIMGPACTVATEPVAGLGNYMNMSQVSSPFRSFSDYLYSVHAGTVRT